MTEASCAALGVSLVEDALRFPHRRSRHSARCYAITNAADRRQLLGFQMHIERRLHEQPKATPRKFVVDLDKPV